MLRRNGISTFNYLKMKETGGTYQSKYIVKINDMEMRDKIAVEEEIKNK